MKNALISIMMLCAASTAAHAAEAEYLMHTDNGIRTVQYNPSQVVYIYTGPGNPTLIQFEDDETVVDPSKGMVGMGDAKAWSVGAKSNSILMKPLAKAPDTKLLVVTSKRTYAFKILTAPPDIEPTLIVRFDYPDSKIKAAQLAAKKQALIDEKLGKLPAKDGAASSKNTNYMKQGDEALAPSSVYDDGLFTYMRFDSSRELPVIYKLLPDGTEALTNPHMVPETGTLVVHETASNFLLRYGTAVMAIRNDGFNPAGKLNVLGTTVPNAVRMKKDEL